MLELNQDIRERAEGALGYTFRDPALLGRALTHASIADDRLESNERLEFLGDAILGAVVCEHLFHEYPEHGEGELTKVKSAVVSRKVCAQVSNQLGLTELLSLGKGIDGQQPLPASLAAAVYEALVAAVYLDGGLTPTRHFILRHIRPVIEEAAASAHQENFKSALQQHAQKHLDELPVYHLLEESGPDHSKRFQVCAEVAGQRFAAAWGESKKQAEQHAALLALKELGLLGLGSTADLEDADGLTD